jgi:hypothetical protein
MDPYSYIYRQFASNTFWVAGNNAYCMLMLRWIDSNADGLIQMSEIMVIQKVKIILVNLLKHLLIQ